MIDNSRVGVPLDELEASDLFDYFKLERDITGEYLLVQREDSNFYFICSDDCNIEQLCLAFDWYIVSKGRFNERLIIGMGLAGKYCIDAELYRVQDEQTLQMWNDILRFTFEGDFIRNFYPYTNTFQGTLRLDGAQCFYIHDYVPVSRGMKLSTESKKISNLVFRFLCVVPHKKRYVA